MTKLEEFIVKMSDILEKKLPEGLTLLKDNEHRGMMRVTVIGAREVTLVLYGDEEEGEVRCFSCISPGSILPDIIKDELHKAAGKIFSLASIKIPVSKLYETNISGVVDDLLGAFNFYREKIRKCQENNLERKMRELVIRTLEI